MGRSEWSLCEAKHPLCRYTYDRAIRGLRSTAAPISCGCAPQSYVILHICNIMIPHLKWTWEWFTVKTKTHGGVLSKVKKYLYFVCLMSYFKPFLELKAKPKLLIPMELNSWPVGVSNQTVHALHTHRSVLELYWDAEPILSQALWGSPDRRGIYNNKNKSVPMSPIQYSRRHYPSGVIHYIIWGHRHRARADYIVIVYVMLGNIKFGFSKSTNISEIWRAHLDLHEGPWRISPVHVGDDWMVF